MVTNYPQQFTATDTIDRPIADRSVVARAVTRLNQTLCGLTGHDSLRHLSGTRVSMRCMSCGHESPGWEVAGRGPRRRFDGDARRHQMGTHNRLDLRKTA
jgi:hypothetical protein